LDVEHEPSYAISVPKDDCHHLEEIIERRVSWFKNEKPGTNKTERLEDRSETKPRGSNKGKEPLNPHTNEIGGAVSDTLPIEF
jgi:hypothetical protein